jgi:ribosome-binding protein aMBF1 (putative translation factor)
MDRTSVGVAIRKARQRKRMTQVALAEKLGVSESTVVNWEKDAHYPQRYAGAIEALLGIDLPEPEPAES